jgi:hypothetical protein
MSSPVAEYLSELALRLEAHLGRRLAGAWLIGSGALGDFDRMRSDVDVQAVCTARLARTELERLVATLSHPALRCPAAIFGSCSTRETTFHALRARRFSSTSIHAHGSSTTSVTTPTPSRASGLCWTPRSRASAGPCRASPQRAAATAAAAAGALRAAGRARLVSRLRRRRDGARGLPGIGLGDAGTLAVEGRCRGMGRRPARGPAPVAKALARRVEPAEPGPEPSEVEAVLGPVERLLAGRARRPAPALAERLST